MKKQLFILLFLSSTSLQTIAQPSYVPTNGLIGWWPFNGNANDESGNGNNGTVNGATLTTDRFGVANKAYSFDGVNDYIDVGNPSGLGNNPQSYTQTGWAYLGDFNDAYVFITKRHDNSGNDWATPVSTLNSTFIFFADDAFYQNAPKAETNSLSTNQWYHLAFVKSSDTYSIYVNGDLVESILDNHSMGGSNNNLIMGAQLAWPEFMKGKLDDMAVYNRALTECEIRSLFLSGTSSITTQPASQSVAMSSTNTAQFSVTSSAITASYQWQTNLGLGFQNLSDAGQYSGTSTNVLSVNNITIANNNQQFRCIVTDGTCEDTTNIAVLIVIDDLGFTEYGNLFQISPNPATNNVTISTQEARFDDFTILDAQGRIIQEGKLTGKSTLLDLSRMASGNYLLRIGHQQTVLKLVKE